jgi:CSLREA domain-containing protein
MNKRLFTVALAIGIAALLLFGIVLALVHPTRAASQAVIVVNTTDDELKTDGDCSLREAITAANTDTVVDQCAPGSGADTIALPAGVYTLTISGTGENLAATGDLDITQSLALNGAGASMTVIDGGALDRVFHINPAQAFGVAVSLTDLTVKNGIAGNGAGLYVDASGTLTLTRTTISENTATALGGGIYNFTRFSTLTVLTSTISHNASGDPDPGMGWQPGGGIYNEGGRLTVISTQIVDNSARGIDSVSWDDGQGGSGSPRMHVEGSTISRNKGGIHTTGNGVIDGSIISENDSFERGGGILTGGKLAVINTMVISNTTPWNGGGIANDGELHATNCDISGNSANGEGGGFHNSAFFYPASDTDPDINPVTITNSTIANNQAGDSGGGIFTVQGSKITLINSTISGNTASGFQAQGGGIYSEAELEVRESTIADNKVTGFNTSGGGMFLGSWPRLIVNTTISGNSADAFGGGLFISLNPGSGNTMAMNNLTVTDNTCDLISDNNGDGGGIFHESGSVTIQNSIIAGNFDNSTGTQHPDCSSAAGGISSTGHNLVGAVDGCHWTNTSGDRTGTNLNPLDPKLGPLSDNGGDTPTHAPLTGSPALNTGNPAVPGGGGQACEARDQRRFLRLLQGPACDMGAFEVQVTAVLNLWMPLIRK